MDLQRLVAHASSVSCGPTAICIDPQRRFLVSGGADLTVKLFSLEDLSAEIVAWDKAEEAVTAVAISPDAKWVASGSEDHCVNLYEVETRAHTKLLTRFSTVVRCLAFNPAGTVLAACAEEQNIKLVTWHESTEVRVLSGHQGPVMAVSWNHKGDKIASAGSDGYLRVWNAQTGSAEKIIPGVFPLPVTKSEAKYAFHYLTITDREFLVIPVIDGVQLWDTEDYHMHHFIPSPFPQPRFVAFSACGTHAVLASSTQKKVVVVAVKPRQPETENTSITLENQVSDLAWNGTSLLLADTAGGITLWENVIEGKSHLPTWIDTQATLEVAAQAEASETPRVTDTAPQVFGRGVADNKPKKILLKKSEKRAREESQEQEKEQKKQRKAEKEQARAEKRRRRLIDDEEEEQAETRKSAFIDDMAEEEDEEEDADAVDINEIADDLDGEEEDEEDEEDLLGEVDPEEALLGHHKKKIPSDKPPLVGADEFEEPEPEIDEAEEVPEEPIEEDVPPSTHFSTFAPHPRVQPGATPLEGERQFLACNNIGVVKRLVDGDRVSIVADFADQLRHRPIRISDRFNFVFAAIGPRGVIFASRGEAEEGAYILYKPLEGWGAHTEWTCTFPRGEQVEAVCIGDTWSAITTNRYTRVLSFTGVETAVLSLPRVVACVGSKALMAWVYEEGPTLRLSVFNMDKRSAEIVASPVVLSTPSDRLTWIGWTDEYFVATADTSGVIRVLSPGFGHMAWVPVYDPTITGNVYWPIGLNMEQLFALKCEPGTIYPASDCNPLRSEIIDLHIPVLAGGHAPKDKLMRTRVLAEKAFHTAEVYTPEMMKVDTQMDKCLLELFTLALKNERTARALDIGTMFHLRRSLEAAMRQAHENQQVALVDKLRLLLQVRFGKRKWAVDLPDKAQRDKEKAFKQQLKTAQRQQLQMMQQPHVTTPRPVSTPMGIMPTETELEMQSAVVSMSETQGGDSGMAEVRRSLFGLESQSEKPKKPKETPPASPFKPVLPVRSAPLTLAQAIENLMPVVASSPTPVSHLAPPSSNTKENRAPNAKDSAKKKKSPKKPIASEATPAPSPMPEGVDTQPPMLKVGLVNAPAFPTPENKLSAHTFKRNAAHVYPTAGGVNNAPTSVEKPVPGPATMPAPPPVVMHRNTPTGVSSELGAKAASALQRLMDVDEEEVDVPVVAL
eukprot:TRINITY_DN67422_c0_g1_i1.p1 TRINITY_DN67422_c0_g1~~TRINITY_DN67422_c0_g1_i1.p1  ORF type:complete len:1195 (+),score=211.61 TRINITY_DN67422_c0_g1_i1:39-3587(+)